MDKFNRGLDYAERLFVVLLAAPYLIAFARYVPTHPFALAAVATEMMTVLFILVRRPGQMPITAYPWLIGLLGAAFGLLVRPGHIEIAPDAVTSTMMVGGLLLSVWAKIALNRSFGAVAANRGVKVGGPYRFVRHPMYLGYFVSQLGLMLSAFSWQLAATLCAAWLVQFLRILAEEKVLLLDPDYRAFAKRVPRRVLPGL